MSKAQYRLIKLSGDDKGINESNFNVGEIITGCFDEEPIVGSKFVFYHGAKIRITAIVQEVFKNGVFKTQNSTYRLHESHK